MIIGTHLPAQAKAGWLRLIPFGGSSSETDGPVSVPAAVAAILAAGTAVLVAIVALMTGLRCPPDSAMGAPSFVAAFVFLLPLIEIALLLVVRHR
jgi:hypothetical protein